MLREPLVECDHTIGAQPERMNLVGASIPEFAGQLTTHYVGEFVWNEPSQ